jgi:predicted nucleotidyltransferase
MTVWVPLGESVPSEADARVLAARIRAAWPEAEVWLFGSLAHGRARLWSDIDLAVVLPDSAFVCRRATDVAVALRHAAGTREHGLDLVVFRRFRFAARAGDANALEAVVQREGRRIA